MFQIVKKKQGKLVWLNSISDRGDESVFGGKRVNVTFNSDPAILSYRWEKPVIWTKFQ